MKIDSWKMARARNIYTIKLLRFLRKKHYKVWMEWKDLVYEEERRKLLNIEVEHDDI